jgi:chromosome segregation ATPase
MTNDEYLEDRVKAFEEWTYRHDSVHDTIDNKVKDLEQFTNLKLALREETTDLRKQVKDLEVWKKQHGELFHTINGDITPLLGRLDKLEETILSKAQFVGGMTINDTTFTDKEGVLQRLKDLEEWKKEHNEGFQDLEQVVKVNRRIENLEEWKDKRYHNIEHQNNRIFEIERKQRELEEREQDGHNVLWNKVEKLEEWKQYHAQYNHDFRDIPTNDKKVIDKKVWEEIKTCARNVNNPNAVYWLVEAIKKADPTWCPDD